MTEELEEWFSDLATVEQEIRQDIARYEKENLTPLEFGVRVRRHPQMAITARMKMQSAVECEVSYGGQMVQTILFNHRDQAWLKHNLEAGNRLVRTLVEGEHPIFTRDGRVLFLNVPVSQVQTFLKDYQFHENSTQLRADLLAGYISDQNKYGDLKIWDIGLVGRKPAPGIPTLTFADHIEIPMIERARIPRSEGPANLKAITSQRDRHLLRDLCDDTGLLTGSGNRGLLLLYPIDRNSKPAGPRSSRKPLEAVEHLLGAALVFPESRHPSPQSYFTPDLSGVEREEPEDLDDDADTLEGVE